MEWWSLDEFRQITYKAAIRAVMLKINSEDKQSRLKQLDSRGKRNK